MRGLVLSILCAALGLAGCSPGGGSGGNVNRNDNNGPSFETSEEIDLGSNGIFELSGGAAVQHNLRVTLEDVLISALAVRVVPTDVTIDTNGIGSNGPIALEVRVAEVGDDACSEEVGAGVGEGFELFLGTNGVVVEPSELELVGSAINLVQSGEFEMCLRASSETGQSLTISRLLLLLNTTVSNLTCSEIFALSEFQDALDLLADEGHSFDLRRGSDPLDITGTYDVALTVEFDPDGVNEGQSGTRTDTFTEQSEGTVVRETGGVELEHFITGTPSGVSLCVRARSNNPACDQTIARVESYVSSNGVLEGNFLAVVLERHPSDSADCGEAGDFIFGRITLTPQGAGPAPPLDNVNENDNSDGGTDPLDDPDPPIEPIDPLDDGAKKRGSAGNY